MSGLNKNKKANFSKEKFSCFPKPSRFCKKGVSIIVAYVLLIVIAISLSALVYNWLRFQVTPGGDEECPEGVDLIIKEIICSGDDLNITLQNKGLFTLDGFIIRVNDRVGAEFGVYAVDESGELIEPGGESFNEYDLSGLGIKKAILLDVQPFVFEEGRKLFCSRVSSTELDC